MKQITYVTPVIGSLDVVVKENLNYPNTFEIGNKRIDFSEILPDNMNLHKLDSYHIIIYEGVYTMAAVIVNPDTYIGTITSSTAKHEELLVTSFNY